MDNTEHQEHNREVAKLCFEFFKHFTTLATVVTLIELALFEQLQLNTVVAVASAILSALTVLFSIAGMLFVLVRAGVEGVFLGDRDNLFALLFLSSTMFLLSISGFASGAAYSSSGWELMIVVLLGFALVGFATGAYLTRLLGHQ